MVFKFKGKMYLKTMMKLHSKINLHWQPLNGQDRRPTVAAGVDGNGPIPIQSHIWTLSDWNRVFVKRDEA